MATVLGPDVYHGNVDLVPADRIAADPRFGFVILKATEGVEYPWASTWFPANWRALGETRLARGAYHYLILRRPGKDQAEFLLQTVEAAGGFRDTDLHPIVDVEWKLNDGATEHQVLDCLAAFADRIHREGHKVIRYGRTLFRDLSIATPTGCDLAWVPRYNDELGPTDDIGFPEPDLWQYTNGEFNFTPWPGAAPGMRPGDVSVVLTDLGQLTVGGAAPRLRQARAAARPKTPSPASWSDADWEAFESRLPRPGEPEMRVREFVLGQLDRRAGRPRPAEPGPRQAGWLHEDDVIAIRKAVG
jgi:Glycosyl hydrolases family 25